MATNTGKSHKLGKTAIKCKLFRSTISNLEYYALVEQKKALFVEIYQVNEEIKSLISNRESLSSELTKVSNLLALIKKEEKDNENLEKCAAFIGFLESKQLE